jgi:hypothetical protein
MTRRIPDIDDLFDGEADAHERDRLARVHVALTRADPLPELPSSLARPPAVGVRARPRVRYGRRRRRLALAAAAVIIALAAGGGAYLATTPGGPSWHLVAMRATSAAPSAHATLRIGVADHAGNWPLTLSVRGLAPVSRGSYYEMFLTDRGRLIGACGTFRVDAGTTVVQLNVPYALDEYSGWVIKRVVGRRSGPPLLTT